MQFIPLFVIKVRFAQDGTLPRTSFAITNGNVSSTKVAAMTKQTIGSFLCFVLMFIAFLVNLVRYIIKGKRVNMRTSGTMITTDKAYSKSLL